MQVLPLKTLLTVPGIIRVYSMYLWLTAVSG